MATIPRPCIVCGQLTTNQSRCEQHRIQLDNARYKRRGPRPHYQGDYAKRAAQVRRNATTCWLCGDTARTDDPWTADHLLPSDPDSPLLPAHRSCNSRRGNGTRGQRTR